ncbi:MAG: thioredoxin [Candidatus Diapherotrites archaeon]|nr:thioredoxin [Candidatus Diapherotrites archaeon]
MSGENIIEADDKDFKEKVIEQSKRIPVVVDFWAAWCMPCLMLSPLIEKIAAEYKGRVLFVKVNVDESPETSREFGIMSIPTVKMFKNGKEVDEFLGALPEPLIKEWIEKNLKE